MYQINIGNGNALVMFASISSSLALISLVILISNSTLVLVQASVSTGSSRIVSSSAAPHSNAANILNGKLEKITSLSNILASSMVDGIQVSAVNVGDTDLTVTLKYQTTSSAVTGTATKNTNATTMKNVSNVSLPVTVVATKLPIANLTEIVSAIEALRGGSALAATSRNTNVIDALTGHIGPNGDSQSNALPILSLLKNVQIGAASIVNANWTLPQTVSMGFLGLGNRIAASAPSDFVLVIVVPFQGESTIPTLELG